MTTYRILPNGRRRALPSGGARTAPGQHEEPGLGPPPTTYGMPWAGGYWAGTHTDDGVTYNLVVAPYAAVATTLAWMTSPTSATGATSTTNGPANSAMLTPDSKFPAAAHARNYTGGGYTDWYLPAEGEAAAVVLRLRPSSAPVEAFQSTGEERFRGTYIMTSTESSTNNCRRVTVSTSSAGVVSKTTASSAYEVRPIRRVPADFMVE